MSDLAEHPALFKCQSSEAQAARLELWDDYRAVGLRRMHSIIPGWKVPGVWSGSVGAWTPVSVWKDDSYEWRRVQGYRRWVGWGAGIGVNGAELAGLDVDISDNALAADALSEIEREFDRVLHRDNCSGGMQIPIRVGRAPKFLIPFWWAGEPGDNRWSVISTPAGASEAQRIEIIGDGRQWVAEGWHPSGRGYAWPRGRLLDAGVCVPVLDAAGVRRVLGALRRGLGLGGRITQRTAAKLGGGAWARAPWNETPAERATRMAGQLCSEEDGREIMAWVPNDKADRAEWIRVAHALKGASGGADWGLQLFLEWDAKHPDTGMRDAVEAERRWEGINLMAVQAGVSVLAYLAEKNGWPGGLARRSAALRQAMSQTAQTIQTIQTGGGNGP